MAQKRIFVLIPFQPEFSDVYQAIQSASIKSEEYTNQSYILYRTDELQGVDIHNDILGAISKSDLIIADTTGANANVLYELGFAEAMDKPVIIINQREYQAPFNIHDRRVLLYDRKRLHKELIPHLMDAITAGTRNPEEFTKAGWKKAKDEKEPAPSVFVSYSHIDKEYLSRFRVHTKPLERKGVVDIWADTEIKVGEKWKETIEQALSNAVIAVLMVSADFLASDFIVDNELPPLLEAAEKEGTKILPVIIKPCRFAREPHLAKFQALNAPENPLLLMPEIEQEVLWDKLAYEIEVEIESRSD